MSGVRIPPNVAIHLEQAWIELVGDLDARLPQELESEILFEGARKQITINAYERNEKARRQCITHYGCVCKVCGFDFGKTYGDVGEGYIQVHHIVPLATVAKEYEVNPIEDLIPVCANCHAMIHKRKPAYTIEEVKGFLGYK